MPADQPVTDADVRAALAGLASSLAGPIATSAKDFGQDPLDSWVYGIVLGWDCEEDHGDGQHDDICGGDLAMRELAAKHGWTDEEVARLRSYRSAVRRALATTS